MIGRLLHWFYCLNFPEALMVIALPSVLFSLADNRWHRRILWRICTATVLVALTAVILYTTLGNRSSVDHPAHCFIPFGSYREAKATGNLEIYRSNLMNVLLFYPAGLLTVSLLPRKWPDWCRCLLSVTVLAACSAGIEFVQYCGCLGRCEIDDMIHNTTGALLGCLAALWLSSVCRKILPHFLRLWQPTEGPPSDIGENPPEF